MQICDFNVNYNQIRSLFVGSHSDDFHSTVNKNIDNLQIFVKFH